MATRDWFRRATWSADDRAVFETKLSRSRGQRSEHLRIQASTLAGTGGPANARGAIELASRYLEENPEGLFRASTHATIARALTTLGEIDSAIEAYRRAVAAERAVPNVRSCLYIEFAWFAATRKLSGIYDEVIGWMDNMEKTDLVLPVHQYHYFGALSLISSDLGDADHAKRMAGNALRAAERQKGPFERYPDIGVVSPQEGDVAARIRRLAS